MVRSLSLVLLLGCSFAAAPSAPPVQPTTTRTAIRTDYRTLELQSYQLMLAKKFAEARQPLDVVYNATRADVRTRALVLNHAILDLGRPVFVMRALKDLLSYLAAHSEEDELATNVLGSCLDVASAKPELQQSELWKAGIAEWQKRDSALETAHGQHRWGTKWLTDQEFADLKAKLEESNKVMEVQDGRVKEAYKQLDDAVIRRNGADAKLPPFELPQASSWHQVFHGHWVDGPGYHDHTVSGVYRQGAYFIGGGGYGPGTEDAAVAVREDAPPIELNASASAEEKEQLNKAVKKAKYEFNDQMKRRYELLRARPTPVWPTQYPPVSPFEATTQPYSKSPGPTTKGAR